MKKMRKLFSIGKKRKMRTQAFEFLKNSKSRQFRLAAGNQRHVINILGIKIDTDMKRHLLCAYIGLCVLTVISVSNYYLIKLQGRDIHNAELTLKARWKREAAKHEKIESSLHDTVYRQPESHYEDPPVDGGGVIQANPPVLNSLNTNSNEGPVKNVYYVKVHKAGSTTLQNIMFRFAMKHDLRVAIYNRPWGMPYPEYAKPEYLYENMTDPAFKKYNMICDHTVYDRDSVAPYMDENYESIAILREPYSHLVSAFDFWGLAKRFKLHKTRDPLHEFLTKDPNQFKDITPHFNRTKNMQAFHFGHVDYHDNRQESIDNLIQHVDKHFKLVMMRERFEESLILMRHKFRWDFEDILYMDQFVNTQPKAKIRNEKEDEHLRNVHKAFAPVDYALYDHFSKKLDSSLAAQGDELLGEVLYFKETNRKIAEFCENVCSLFPFESIKNLTVKDILPKLKEGIVLPGNKWHKDIHITYENCAYMKFWTYQYHNALRVKQLPASCPQNKGIGPAVDEAIFDPHDIQKYGYCDTENHILFNFPLDVFKEIVLDVPMHPVTNAKIAKAPKCKGRGEPSIPT